MDSPHLTLKTEGYVRGRAAAERLGAYFPRLDFIAQRDESFCIYHSEQLVYFCPCFIVGGIAGWHDGTSSIPYRAPVTLEIGRSVARLVSAHIQGLLSDPAVSTVKLLTDDYLEEELADACALADNSRMYGYVDLSLSEPEIWSRIRRRYRSYINGGKAHIERVVLTSPSELTGAAREFIRGSLGMTDEKFFAMQHNLEESRAALLLYHARGSILGAVCGSIWKQFSDGRDIFYEVGAFNHTLGVKAHVCLYDAALYFRSMATYERFYVLNASPCVRDTTDPNQEKLADIDFFKQGLCTHLFVHQYKIISPRTETQRSTALSPVLRMTQ